MTRRLKEVEVAFLSRENQCACVRILLCHEAAESLSGVTEFGLQNVGPVCIVRARSEVGSTGICCDTFLQALCK